MSILISISHISNKIYIRWKIYEKRAINMKNKIYLLKNWDNQRIKWIYIILLLMKNYENEKKYAAAKV
jgi:hypothetical protein